MPVAIIGSGKMGSGFARLLASKGFDIAIGDKNPEKADVIILAVKYEDAAEALKAAGDLTNKVVVDYLEPDYCRLQGAYDRAFYLGRRGDSEACPRRQGREGVQHDFRRTSPNRKPQRPQGPDVHR